MRFIFMAVIFYFFSVSTDYLVVIFILYSFTSVTSGCAPLLGRRESSSRSNFGTTSRLIRNFHCSIAERTLPCLRKIWTFGNTKSNDGYKLAHIWVGILATFLERWNNFVRLCMIAACVKLLWRSSIDQYYFRDRQFYCVRSTAAGCNPVVYTYNQLHSGSIRFISSNWDAEQWWAPMAQEYHSVSLPSRPFWGTVYQSGQILVPRDKGWFFGHLSGCVFGGYVRIQHHESIVWLQQQGS